MVHIEIGRAVARDIQENPGWSLVYGRRKVGKTYLIENFVEHDVFLSVRIDRSISARGIGVDEIGELGTFTRSVVEHLDRGKIVVIDEFQRLPMGILEEISRSHPRGKLILTGSSMKVVGEITGKNSPLLGLLRPFKIGLIKPSDILRSLSRTITPETAIECAPLLRDPWTIPFYNPRSFLKDIASMLSLVVPGLVGEIFTEDDRQLTRTYSSILSLLGSGMTDYSDIANTLHARGIIGTSSSSGVLQYMKNMVDMGLLERIKVFGKKKFNYSIPSLPIGMFYYLDSRYGLSDREVDYREIVPTAENLLRFGIEAFIADALAELVGGRKENLKNSEKEIDVLITERNKPVLVGEVKWGRANQKDVTTFLAKVEGFDCRKVLFCKEPIETDEVEVMTPPMLIKAVSSGNYD